MYWVVYMHHPGRICGGSSPEVASPEVVNRHRKWKGDISPRFSPVFPLFFLTGTSLDYMYGQWNCESNMYRSLLWYYPL